MYRYGRSIRFLSSASRSGRTKWDPVSDLELKDPALILLEKCSTRYQFKQILGQIMRKNLIGETFPMSRVLLFSAVSQPENLDLAILLFNHFTPHPNLYIYNTMILGLSPSTSHSFTVYSSMLKSGLYPDKQTLIYLLQTSKCAIEVKQVHCHALVTGLLSQGYLQNSLIKWYSENGELELGHLVLDKMQNPDAVSYNVLILSYAKKGNISETFELFHEMVFLSLEPDEFTMLGLLVACGQLGNAPLGKSVHAWIERKKSPIYSNLILSNALMDMYVKCKELKDAHKIFDTLPEKDAISWNIMIAGYSKVGELEIARKFFDQTPKKDPVSWNSLIAGYAQRGDCMMVKRLFIGLLAENVRTDSVTMVSLISAAAEGGILDMGRWAHGLTVKMQLKLDAFLGSALIDMYSRCGSIERASVVFDQVTERDTTVWTTMLTGFAFHGYGNKALELLSNMQQEAKPNEVTFISVLTACSHSGLVDKGLEIFNNMKRIYDIEPGIEHYGCLVDLLGRSGRISDAFGVIEKMPMKPSQSIWGTMLSACRAYGNVEMAENVLKELLKLEPEKEGGYVIMSNMYATCGRWSYTDKVRGMMERRGIKKTAGCSTVVVDEVAHNFVAADKRHPRWLDIASMLCFLKSETSSESLLDCENLVFVEESV